MSQIDEQMITRAAVASFADTADPRLQELFTSLTRHLHAFVSETRLTLDEWMHGIEFLTAVGKMCSETRQEFILLSDVFGVSMLVDAINHEASNQETETTVLGPFFVENAPFYEQGADISGGSEGEPLYVDIGVSGGDGQPIAGAKVEVWQSDAEGFYDVQRPELENGFNLRGNLIATEDGRARFWSILPTAYPIPHDGPVGSLLEAAGRHPWRPAHVHFKLSAPGYRTLVTHLFLKESQYLDSDVVFGVKDSLICEFPHHSEGIAPDGRNVGTPWRSLKYEFILGAENGASG